MLPLCLLLCFLFSFTCSQSSVALAKFNYPYTLIHHKFEDTLYIADTVNFSIRKVNLTSRWVNTVIPSGSGGLIYGSTWSETTPELIYLSDQNNHVIKQLNLTSNQITILAGQLGTPGSGNGSALVEASFFNPQGLVHNGIDSLYIADSGNSIIRQLNLTSGLVTTIAGIPGSAGYLDGDASTALFWNPTAIAFYNETLYICDTNNHVIRKIHLTSTPITVTTLAGIAGVSGSNDGIATTAKFFRPSGISIDPKRSVIYISDTSNHLIRQVNITEEIQVTTLAGTIGIAGSTDGIRNTAKLNRPQQLIVSNTEEHILYIAEPLNHLIRKLNVSSLQVTTVAGVATSLGSNNGRSHYFSCYGYLENQMQACNSIDIGICVGENMCNCKSGYESPNCEKRGLCRNGMCSCKEGFTGVMCESTVTDTTWVLPVYIVGCIVFLAVVVVIVAVVTALFIVVVIFFVQFRKRETNKVTPTK